MAENWYNTPRQSVYETKVRLYPHDPLLIVSQGGSSVLEYFKGSLVKALQYTFPNVTFEETEFENMSSTYIEF